MQNVGELLYSEKQVGRGEAAGERRTQIDMVGDGLALTVDGDFEGVHYILDLTYTLICFRYFMKSFKLNSSLNR